MKKILVLFLLLMVGAGMSYALPFDKYTINRSELPQEAQEMLDTYFPKAKIGMIKIDKHLLKKPDYEVRLTNGTTIEFSNKGKWREVDCKTREVPQGLISKPIRNYVSKNFPDVKIVKIEKKSSGYIVELSDDVELKFDLLGIFKGVKIED